MKILLPLLLLFSTPPLLAEGRCPLSPGKYHFSQEQLCTSEGHVSQPGFETNIIQELPWVELSADGQNDEQGLWSWSHGLDIGFGEDCSSLFMEYTQKNNLEKKTRLDFSVDKVNGGEITIREKERNPVLCQRGVCENQKEKKTLKLLREGDKSVVLMGERIISGTIQFIPYRRTKKWKCHLVRQE